MAISLRNNRALNRVLRESRRARPPSETAPQETDAPAYTICADIPERYNDSYVRAIPQDPQNTFVYWELPKEHAYGSLFADKGTAHVGNDEAVRIGEQLSDISTSLNDRISASLNDRISTTLNDRPTVSPAPFNDRWDNGNNQYGVDNYHHVDWDNPNQYNFDGDNHRRGADDCRQNDTGYYQISWDNGNQYRLEEAYQHLRGLYADNLYSWDDGGRSRRDDVYQRLRHLQEDGIYQLNWNDGGDYTTLRRDDGAAFSEMLSDLIARCNQYIADRRLSGDGPLDRAMSSGLLCGAGGEPRT